MRGLIERTYVARVRVVDMAKRTRTLNDGVKPDFCVVCGLDFESHRWLRPAIAARAGLPHGHDFTPISGPPRPHPYWSPHGDGYRRYVH